MQRVAPLLKLAIKADVPVILWGKHGIGKTSVINQLAEEMGFAGCETLILSQREATDLIGMPGKIEKVVNGQPTLVSYTAMPDWLFQMWEKYTTTIKNATPEQKKNNPYLGWHILFLDELNRGDRYIINAAHQLVLEKRIGLHQLPPCYVVAACNPEDDNESSLTEFGDAFMNRFSHVGVNGHADEGFFKYVTKNASWNDLTIDFLTANKEYVATDTLSMEEIFKRLKPTRRGWDMVQRVIGALGDDKSGLHGVAFDLIRGIVGPTVATTFVNYCDKHFDRILSYEELTAFNEKTKMKIKRFVDMGKLGVLEASLQRANDKIMKSFKKPTDWPENERIGFFRSMKLVPKDLQVAFWQSLGGYRFWEEVANSETLLPNDIIQDLQEILSLTVNS